MQQKKTKPSWDDIRKHIRKEDFVNSILNFDTDTFKKDSAKVRVYSKEAYQYSKRDQMML